ncbi:hypothetical protein AUK40_02890 [Candidatus Wirthbacteria bacterium CG2_30_54_11]|uniref:Uncharacterized protein n=1 Tax=Candidatus Wirthbacteria bacterium CG2_30_54_11 TaxID=1817892 RepID=A0A1J5J237_9BACT|nr:MAG: hypothetical protein AUK40_02890 [Candidatus Wirthbacteria bacterium CG2_30_54_11]
MTDLIDRLIKKIPLYRLTLYYLENLCILAVLLGWTGRMGYSGFSILSSMAVVLVSCFIANAIGVSVTGARSNRDAVTIAALIIALIAPPAVSFGEYSFLVVLSILAMASKYILTLGKRHIFNPVALAAVIASFIGTRTAVWWVGVGPMVPLVIAGGILIARKFRREDMVTAFFLTSTGGIMLSYLLQGMSLSAFFSDLAFHSPLFFLGFVMLTDPKNAPARRRAQIIYGIVVGLLFIPQVHIFGIASSPEMALVAGNLIFLASRLKLTAASTA